MQHAAEADEMAGRRFECHRPAKIFKLQNASDAHNGYSHTAVIVSAADLTLS